MNYKDVAISLMKRLHVCLLVHCPQLFRRVLCGRVQLNVEHRQSLLWCGRENLGIHIVTSLQRVSLIIAQKGARSNVKPNLPGHGQAAFHR